MTSLTRPASTDTLGTTGVFLDVVLDEYADLIEAVEATANAAMPKAGGTFTGDIVVPDEAYDAATWNGSLEVPTKNAVRDKIESISAGGATVVRKTADESVTSSTTYQDDNELLFSVGANETWVATFVLLARGAQGGDIKVQFTAPSGAALSVGGHAPSTGTTAFEGDILYFADATTGALGGYGIASGSDEITIVAWVAVATGANAGSVTLQWAQNTSNATATVLAAGSFLTANKVA